LLGPNQKKEKKKKNRYGGNGPTNTQQPPFSCPPPNTLFRGDWGRPAETKKQNAPIPRWGGGEISGGSTTPTRHKPPHQHPTRATGINKKKPTGQRQNKIKFLKNKGFVWVGGPIENQKFWGYQRNEVLCVGVG